VFNNFDAIDDELINNKKRWLKAQDRPITSEELDMTWYHVVLDIGGSGLFPKSRVKYIEIPERAKTL